MTTCLAILSLIFGSSVALEKGLTAGGGEGEEWGGGGRSCPEKIRSGPVVQRELLPHCMYIPTAECHTHGGSGMTGAARVARCLRLKNAKLCF